jgi:tRNA (cytidine/uridine-2'-O-)-methyltransferase
MINVVLVEPEIPPNTGNVIRLCANTGAQLHLIEPLGFPIDHAKMRRAGLDYHEFTAMTVHSSWNEFLSNTQADLSRLFAFTTHGSRNAFEASFQPNDWLIFGSETRGLHPDLRNSFPLEQRLRFPMREGNRSMNLSNAVAVAVYEAWRQLEFK